MTVREALDGYREKFKGKVESLVMCKYELFYILKDTGTDHKDTVYPVSADITAEEAAFFGVGWSEQ